jgi:hypothetical protein
MAHERRGDGVQPVRRWRGRRRATRHEERDTETTREHHRQVRPTGRPRRPRVTPRRTGCRHAGYEHTSLARVRTDGPGGSPRRPSERNPPTARGIGA